MTVHIVARHVKLTKPLRDLIEERFDKLEHYFESIISAQVILTVEKKVHRAEMLVHVARQTFKASAEAADLYAAVDSAADKMEVQMKKHKDRSSDHHAAEGIFVKTVQAAFVPEVKFTVVKQVPVAAMDADSAARQMDSLGYSFWLYLDEETKLLNVIFKRQDGSFGLLKPVKK